LGVDDRSGPLFFDISRDVAMATDFVQKMANSLLSSLWHSETVWDIATSTGALTAEMMPVYRGLISLDLLDRFLQYCENVSTSTNTGCTRVRK